MLKVIQISGGGHSIYNVRICVSASVRRAASREEVGQERNHDCEILWYCVSNTDTCLEETQVCNKRRDSHAIATDIDEFETLRWKYIRVMLRGSRYR